MRIHLFKNKRITYYNLEKWKVSTSPILLITGLCGSGKTTFAEKLAKISNVLFVSFDVLKFYDEASKDSQKILDIFLNIYPEIKDLVKTHWKETDLLYTNDKLYCKYCNIFFDFLKNYCKQQNEIIILEGIQIFVRLQPQKTIHMPLIVVGSCSIRSYLNKTKRDYLRKDKKNFLVNSLSDFYLYHIKQLCYLNRYINYYEKYDHVKN